MILNTLNRKTLPVYGQGVNIRDWLHVEDHARALLLLLQQGRRGETYNIGGGAEWRNIDLVNKIVEIIAAIQDVPVETLQNLITFVKDRPGHDLRYAIDCSKIKRELGWQPFYSFTEGLKQTIEWYLQNSDWVENVQSGAYRQWMEVNYVNR